jgi:serine/threonine-protein kinase HipA
MPQTRLFETSHGDRFFGVQRFDREGAQRVHVHTFGNLIQANFRLPSCDYRQLLEVTRQLTRSQDDVARCYRTMVFNVAAHNRDDHAKNFAFRMNSRAEWRLAPAYDLVFATGPGGEHSTSIAGEGQAPTRSHLLSLAEPVGLSIRQAETMIDQVSTAVAGFERRARDLAIEPDLRRQIEGAIEGCLLRLG